MKPCSSRFQIIVDLETGAPRSPKRTWAKKTGRSPSMVLNWSADGTRKAFENIVIGQRTSQS